MERMYAFGHPIFTESDFVYEQITELAKKQRLSEIEKKEAEMDWSAEEEAIRNLPEDYFSGWDVYEVKLGDTLSQITFRTFGSGTLNQQILNDNKEQLPRGEASIRTGLALRIRADRTRN